MRKTVLNAVHRALGAKMVEFGGFDMPVAYTQIRDEHRATRTAAGLFDLCHMGRFVLTGPARAELLDRLVTNDVLGLGPGEAHYALLCNEAGGVIDDVVYYVFQEHILLVVNASNREKDLAWILEKRKAARLEATASVEDASDRLAMLAIQGPRAVEITKRLTQDPIEGLGAYEALEGTIGGVRATLARTGYTGEDGYEIYCPTEHAERIWNALMEMGRPLGLLPVGLGARDTLRLEAAMPLYGHELTLETNPLEAGLGFAVKVKKLAPFCGKAALERMKAEGPGRKLVCIMHDGKKIPREGYAVLHAGDPCGRVTSGTFSPCFERPISMAYVRPELGEVGTALAVDVRGEPLPGKVVKRPFYKRSQS